MGAVWKEILALKHRPQLYTSRLELGFDIVVLPSFVKPGGAAGDDQLPKLA